MKRLVAGILVKIVVISFCGVGTAWPKNDATELFDFANHLYSEKDYYRAITEYKRFIFLFPGHNLVSNAEFQIAMSYFHGEKLDLATKLFRDLSDRYPSDRVGKDALFKLAEINYRIGKYNLAAKEYIDFLSLHPDDDLAEKVTIMLSLCYMHIGKYGDMKSALETSESLATNLNFLKSMTREYEKFGGLPQKSPGLAAGLSAVFPGAGQLYVKRPRDAAISFLLNGLFIWATYETFDDGNQGVGTMLLLVESGWYIGNIYNASNSAHKYNRHVRGEFLKNLELIYAPFISDGDKNLGIGLGIRGRF